MPVSKRRTALGPNGESIKYIDHEELHDDGRLQALLEGAAAIVARPDGYTPSVEATLFRALQACAHAFQRPVSKGKRKRWDPAWLSDLRQKITGRLVHENTGLVYDMLRFSGVSERDSDELHSEGFWTLFRAVVSFNPWLGFRFSTYACTSLRRAYRLVIRRRKRDKEQLATVFADAEANVPNTGEAGRLGVEVLADRVRVALSDNRANLNAAERYVVEKRLLHVPGGKPATLSVLADEFKLSKERVRQIQLTAIRKLREALLEDEMVMSELPLVAGYIDDEASGGERRAHEPAVVMAA